MKIIGMRVEKYIGQIVTGHNCDFEYEDAEMDRHVILGINSDGTKIEVTLWLENGECGSGWCTASWGRIEVAEVDNFNGYQYKPKKEIKIDDIDVYIADDFYGEDAYISNEVFKVSAVGGDSYYPSGYYDVEMDLFIPNGREKRKRPVWIFNGDSSLGKSYLAHLTNKNVYETDSNPNLPDLITEDIIVVGNKYVFDVSDIVNNLFGDIEVIIVSFNNFDR